MLDPSTSDWLARAAASDAPVLILGEPGTGRSRLAREIHAASARAAGPLVEIDPAGFPAELFESELFGFEKGAFTGAERSMKGRVARAEAGTLVLDHVEALPLAAQPKLLRLLAEKRYVPLGGRERQADVRFIALGPEDLGDRLARGVFRPDLYYRLEVLAFRLAPLRERRAELPGLVAGILADLALRLGLRAPEIASASWEWMRDYAWPGNLRQLRNVLERALILDPMAPLSPELPSGSTEARPLPLAELEEAAIRRALAYTRGHQAHAAELLGISRKSLWERRRRYGIP